jgi:hypothetical protein
MARLLPRPDKAGVSARILRVAGSHYHAGEPGRLGAVDRGIAKRWTYLQAEVCAILGAGPRFCSSNVGRSTAGRS